MTVREIYERGIRDLPPIEQLRLATMILEQLTQAADAPSEAGQALQEQLRRATPMNAQLLDMATRHTPPQSWWDEPDDPFAPAEEER